MLISEKINTYLSDHPLFYVTRDVERALSLEDVLKNYYIIANESPLAETVKNHPKPLLIKEGKILSTRELFENEAVKEWVTERSSGRQPHILVFKNTKQIETICKKNNWKLLNPSAELAERIENKISQANLLRTVLADKDCPLPKFRIAVLSECSFAGLERQFGAPFILQFNRAHTGQGTYVIENKIQLEELQLAFPRREAKISEFIEGQVFTVNVCVVPKEGVYIGNPSLQITGQPELTSLKYATVGNDWSAARTLQLTTDNAQLIGNALARMGWRGLFGIDCILKDGELYLIEINARQAASAVCESYLQKTNNRQQTTHDENYGTIMEAHLAALLNIDLKSEILNLKSSSFGGSQIFFRNREQQPIIFKTDLKVGEYAFTRNALEFVKSASSVAEVDPNHFFIISKTLGASYKPNDELIRIQSKNGMVDSQGRLLPMIQDLIKEICKRL